ncbi:hypothetical protein BDQ17DRAFT_1330002 [Cyathus striatus]|nr:hypothetical protein BDQ17DRAFT_1330002 [Cyathus striatus]
MDINLLLGMCQIFPGIEVLKVHKVLNDDKLDDLFFAMFGSLILPQLQKVKEMYIPLPSYVGREKYLKGYLGGWSRLNPSLQNVVLVPGTKWIRTSGSDSWMSNQIHSIDERGEVAELFRKE